MNSDLTLTFSNQQFTSSGKYKCHVCSKQTTSGCSQCQQIYYCSYEHQKQHWPEHRMVCQQQGKAMQRDQTLQMESQKQSMQEQVNADTLQTPKKGNTSRPQTSQVKMEKDQAQTLLQGELQRLRKLIVVHLAKEDLPGAISMSRKCVESSRKLYATGSKSYFFEFMADSLLLVKLLVEADELTQARESLLVVKTQLDSYAQEGSMQKNLKSKDTAEVQQDAKKFGSILTLSASLFYACGDFINCQNLYVQYVQIIENSFGAESLQTSNAYFVTGVFYLQHKRYLQSLACFKRALNVRIQKQPDHKSEGIADCWYNIGLIYKQNGKKLKAIEFLEKALELRREIIGDLSLQVAMCLEILGKIFFQEADFKSALTKFSECFYIRRRLLNNDHHPDLIRISLLIISLYEKVKHKIDANYGGDKMQTILRNVQLKIQNTISSNNLQRFMSSEDQSPFQIELRPDQSLHESQDDYTPTPTRPASKSHFSILHTANHRNRSHTSTDIRLIGVHQKRERAKTNVFLKTQEDDELPEIKQHEEESSNERQDVLLVNKHLMTTLSVDQLILLDSLQNELRKASSLDPNVDLGYQILVSEFVQSLSNIQLRILKEDNMSYFEGQEYEDIKSDKRERKRQVSKIAMPSEEGTGREKKTEEKKKEEKIVQLSYIKSGDNSAKSEAQQKNDEFLTEQESSQQEESGNINPFRTSKSFLKEQESREESEQERKKHKSYQYPRQQPQQGNQSLFL